MYLVPTKTLFIEALQNTFNEDYSIARLQNIHVSMEYPIEKQHYPSIWVDYEDGGSLSTVGVSHIEEELDEDGDPSGKRLFRWQFQGWVQFTIAALTSLERDVIYDELIRVIAMGLAKEDSSAFRRGIENNDLVALAVDFDKIEPRGAAVAPGTPWETDELIYERSIAIQVVGEFVSDPFGLELVPLSKIVWEGYYDEDNFNRILGPGDYDQMDPIISGQHPADD